MRAPGEAKRALRANLRKAREGLGTSWRAHADEAIEQRVLALPEFAQADVILTYLGIGSEVRTGSIIEAALAAGKSVALPRCVLGSRMMRWYRVSSLDGLVPGARGILEPPPNDAYELLLDGGMCMLALVPGLTFDAAGYRLGYGGGFYDTFLAGFDGASVGLCREPQMTDDLHAVFAVEAHDLPVDIVVTEERTLRHTGGSTMAPGP